MRHSLVFLIIVFTFLIHGCKSNETDVRKALVGNWNLREKTGGVKKDAKALLIDSTINLVFDETRYERFERGQMVSMGHYRIITDTMRLNGNISDRLIFKPEVYEEDQRRFFISVKNNELTIVEDTVGGLNLLYKKVD